MDVLVEEGVISKEQADLAIAVLLTLDSVKTVKKAEIMD